jgi:S1-C subfamily serine protease
LDVILSFNGTPIRSGQQLVALIQSTKVGKPAIIQLWRQGEVLEIQASIGESGTQPRPPAQTEEQ